MGERIYKYTLKVEDEQTVQMPKGAVIFAVQNQYSKITMWACVDESQELEDRKIFVLGTGHDIPKEMTMPFHLGTVQIGNLVWHVFENLKPFGE